MLQSRTKIALMMKTNQVFGKVGVKFISNTWGLWEESNWKTSLGDTQNENK